MAKKDTNQPQPAFPLLPLAQEIPQYRQAKLAGKKYVGPMSNISPVWSQFNATYFGKATTNTQSIAPSMQIKGQTTVTPVGINKRMLSPLAPIHQSEHSGEPNLPNILVQKNKVIESLAQEKRQLQVKLRYTENLALKAQHGAQQLQTHPPTVPNTLPKQPISISPDTLALQKNLNSKNLQIEQLQKHVAELQQLVSTVKEHSTVDKTLHTQFKELQSKLTQSEKLFSEEQRKVETLTRLLTEQKKAVEGRETEITKLERLLREAMESYGKSPAETKPVVKAAVAEQTAPNSPQLTTTPNAINGIVKNKGKLEEQAIVMIKDGANHNLRALKTNKLGQFVVTTPLPNGTYYIDVSKGSAKFDIVEIELKGSIVPTVEIVSHEN